MTERELERLIELARDITMSSCQQETQRRSFAYGNAQIENARVTKKMVSEAAEKLERSTRSRPDAPRAKRS